MLLPGAKAPTFRPCSGVYCRVLVISLPSGPSHIGYAAWSGRYFMRESATSNKVSNPNQSFSSIAHNTWRDSFVDSVTTSRSLLTTELRHRTSGSNSTGGDFRRSGDGWKAGFMSFHAFHTLSFPWPALGAGSECEVAECMVRRLTATQKLVEGESLRQCIRQ
jgi:hypothetical protein